jgi:phage tail sheath protein FI
MSPPQPPGGYIEEIPQGPGPIIGVSTDTAAFLGETQSGDFAPRLVTSFADYQQSFGGVFGPSRYMPHAVQGFFENGGRRAVICRISDSDGQSIDKALAAMEGADWRDVSLVYAPHATTDVAKALVAHCEKMRHRFAVIDCAPRAQDASQLSPQAAIAASSRAAFYYPWIYTNEPGTNVRTLSPPGGHVLGIYARTDIERGVFKAPANELVRGAVDIEFAVTQQVQNTLPLKGVNVIRSFQGRGIRVWGARTLSTETDWKFVNVRRLMIFIERSIEEGMQWAAFEPNGPALWRRVITLVSMFLRTQWRAGAFQGQVDREAYFVKCDQATMTQDDIASGRLVCMVGVATVKPAEFVIFRIVQKTLPSQESP